MDYKEKRAWIRLARTDNVGPVTFYRLLDFYKTASRALEALPELSKKGGCKKPLKAPEPQLIDKEIESVEKLGGKILTSADEAYPLSLSALEDAPPVITALGNIDMISRPCIGMVGARNASLNGRKMAEKLAYDCGSQSDVVIVSGLARGIDASAHKGALENGTIAVVGGGVDVIYPRENQELYESISQQGLIIAENPLGWQPRARDFPRRNRILSGLSLGVVVVEATLRSGSLITARLAGEQGRDVYAVPGFPGDPRAAGPNSLIKEGAVLVQCAQDILEGITPFGMYQLKEVSPPDYASSETHFSSGEPDQDSREALLSNLSFTPVTVDELVRSCQLNISVVTQTLFEFELAGRITRYPGNRVALLNGEID